MSTKGFSLTLQVKTDNARQRDKLYVVFFALNDSVQLLVGDKIELTTNEQKTIAMKDENSLVHFYKPGLMGMISPRTKISEGYGFKVTADSVANCYDFLYDNGKISSMNNKTKASEVQKYKFGDMFLKPAAATVKEIKEKIGGGGGGEASAAAAAVPSEETFESSLEGQDLTFALAWKTLGDDKACRIFESIGQVFGCIDGQKDFRKCLQYLTQGRKEGAGPRRMCFAGIKKDGTPSFGKNDIVDDIELENNVYDIGKEGRPTLDQLIYTPDKMDWDMFCKIRLHDSNKDDGTPCTASYAGFINHFFSVQGMGSFYSRLLESFDCSDQAMVQLMIREFKNVMKNFYLIHEPMQVLSDIASNDSKERGITRLVKLRIKIDLDRLESQHSYTRAVLSWVNNFSVEILKNYVVGDKSSSKYDRERAVAFGWDRSTRSIFFDAIKKKGELLWCKRNEKGDYDMHSFVRDCNAVAEKINKDKIDNAKVKFNVGTVFYVRLHFELCLAEFAGMAMSSSGSTLYFRCEITTERRMVATLVDITGAKAKAAELLMGSTVEDILKSVKAVVELTALPTEAATEETRPVSSTSESTPSSPSSLSPQSSVLHLDTDQVNVDLESSSEDIAAISTYNRLSFIVMGKAPLTSIMAWLVKTIWEKTVESNFVFEFAMLWGRYWRCLAEDVREVAQTSVSFFGRENSLQKKIATGILDSRKRIEGQSAKFAQIIKSVKENIHDSSLVHGRLSADQIIFDISSDKWISEANELTLIGTPFKKIAVLMSTPPEAVSMVTTQDNNITKTTVKVESIAAEPSFDVWSLGAILYQMLHPKHHAFLQTCKLCTGICMNADDHVTKKDLQEKISAIKIGSILAQFTDEERISRVLALPCDSPADKAARNLLSCMMLKDPKKRITIERILQHPFITSRPFTRLAGDQAAFDVFLSYRVDSDADTAQLLYDELTSRNYKVW